MTDTFENSLKPKSSSNEGNLSFSTELELSAWRRYQSNKVGFPDLLSLVDSGKINLPTTKDDENISNELRHFLKGEEISENLKQRWKQGVFYTSIGHQFLIYVNPNNRKIKKLEKEKELKKSLKNNQMANSIEDDEGFLLLLDHEKSFLIHDPRGSHIVQEHNQAHVFSFAARIYWHMLRDKEDQVVIASGETGSGKSENIKLILKQLSTLSAEFPRKISGFSELETRLDNSCSVETFVSSAIQVLELLGNAKLPLNYNSSRFHKYIELQFNSIGQMVGAKILDFCLEKQRVVQATPFSKQERNFHIFYELFASGQLTREEKEKIFLYENWRSYKYLNPHNGSKIFKNIEQGSDVDFASQDIIIKKAFKGIGFDAKTIQELFRLFSCVILIGNIEFSIYEAKKEEGAYIKNTDILEKCSYLLGVSPDALTTTLTQKTVTSGGIICADYLSIQGAQKQRDLLAITLYSLVFDHIVSHINKSMNAEAASSKEKVRVWESWIGLMDFSGLENLSLLAGADQDRYCNRFWQFLANFLDENVLQFTRAKLLDFNQQIHAECDNLAYSVEKLKEGSSSWSKELMKTYMDPITGLLCALDVETIKCLDGTNEDDSNSEQNSMGLLKIYNQNSNFPSKRRSLFGGLVENKDAFYLSSNSRSFGIKHYGGISSNSNNSNAYSKKIFYDISDFIGNNKLGGRGKKSQSLKADFVRMIKGTADFTSSKNKYLLSIIDQHVQLQVHPREKRTILSSCMKPDTVKRVPSLRSNGDDLKLNLLRESLNSPKDIIKNKRISQLRENLGEKNQAHEKVDSDKADPSEKISVESRHPTVSSELFSNINNLLSALHESGQCRFWPIVCVKANDDISSKRFHDERVRDQIRRRDIPLFISDKTFEFSVFLSFKSFIQRYCSLESTDEINSSSTVKEYKGHKTTTSVASSFLNREDGEVLKGRVSKIIETYGILTSGGMGKIFMSSKGIYMNEKTYWSLERNLVGVEIERNKFRERYDPNIKVVLHNDTNDEMKNSVEDSEMRIIEKRQKAIQKQKLSDQRILWLRVTTFMTWWIPNFIIKKIFRKDKPEIMQAWREKVTLVFLICLLTGVMLFMISGFGILLCPQTKIYSIDDLRLKYSSQDRGLNYMAINGYVYDISSFPHADPSHPTSYFYDYQGKDASKFFPHGDISECSSFVSVSKRVQIPSAAANSKSPTSASNSPSSNTTSDGTDVTSSEPKHVFETFRNDVRTRSIPVIECGQFAIDMGTISSTGNSDNIKWIVIDNNVYDVTDIINKNIFGDQLSNEFSFFAGKDYSQMKSHLNTNMLACMIKKYYIGVVDTRTNLQCTAAGYSLLILTVILCTVMGVRFITALQLGARRLPEETERYTIIQIPCYTEGEESLKKTIRSCALMHYPDDMKLLFIIADGMIKGSGNDRVTPEIVLDILGVENAFQKLNSDDEVPRFDYVALGT